jgi:hypothetical protein
MGPKLLPAHRRKLLLLEFCGCNQNYETKMSGCQLAVFLLPETSTG